ncbi:N-acetylmuramoyl-L-alanine amidase [Alphaproteobacteria bacterium KMM 3653]|uniref:N-acetylmuramoyl-L-alanine amidase n=1 Tax=Harenicola maris TaxID=2841044 RepID=A0AAP2CMU3_9RHOB|nr:N-acetylmuramoyl-L-alanine amidase [Harenicola maris]
MTSPADLESISQRLISLTGMTARKDWGKVAPNPANMDPAAPYTKIAIHHTGTRTYTHTGLESYHINERGFADIGYHFLIGLDGTMYEGRHLKHKGAHIGVENAGAIGIILLGDFHYQWWDDDDDLTTAHIARITKLVLAIRKFFAIKALGGHREFPNQDTVCPGNALLPHVQAMRSKMGLAAP